MNRNPYSFQIGEFRCTAIHDGGRYGKADFLFSNIETQEYTPALKRHGQHPDKIPNNWTCILIDTGEEKLLVDTGWGTGIAPEGGFLVPNMVEAGITPEEIDVVFLSHGHTDHIGGCTIDDGKLVFPNARMKMIAAEWEFWISESNLAKVSPFLAKYARLILPAIESHIDLISAEMEILPSIQAIPAFGHTPGHSALKIQSQDQTLLCLADTVLHPLHIENPEWLSIFDMDPKQTIKTRKRLLGLAAANGYLVHFFHFDYPGLGHIIQTVEGLKWKGIS